jgi:hypothetical protein
MSTPVPDIDGTLLDTKRWKETSVAGDPYAGTSPSSIRVEGGIADG